MPQLVFEFTSAEIDAVITAVRHIIRDTRYECEMAQRFLQYESCSSFLDGAEALRSGVAVAVVLRPNASRLAHVRYVLLNSPRFNGAKLDAWLGAIEYISPNWVGFGTNCSM